MKHPRLSAIFVAVSAASLLLASASGFAGHKNFKGENYKAEVPPCPPIMMLHDGFYIGAGVGYDSYRVHQNTTTTDTVTDALGVATLFDSDSISLNHSATGWMGGVFAGYGRYFDWAYIALELNANGSAADTSYTWVDNNTFASFNAKVKARGSYGIALLPGMKLNDSTLMYVRLGYLRTNFKGSASVQTAGFTSTITGLTYPAVSGSGSSSKWRSGFQYGVGLETYVAENVSVRGEFDHTSYSSHNASSTFVIGDTGVPSTTFVTTSSSTKFKPSNNEFMLSLLYHFA